MPTQCTVMDHLKFHTYVCHHLNVLTASYRTPSPLKHSANYEVYAATAC